MVFPFEKTFPPNEIEMLGKLPKIAKHVVMGLLSLLKQMFVSRQSTYEHVGGDDILTINLFKRRFVM